MCERLGTSLASDLVPVITVVAVEAAAKAPVPARLLRRHTLWELMRSVRLLLTRAWRAWRSDPAAAHGGLVLQLAFRAPLGGVLERADGRLLHLVDDVCRA